MNYPIHPVTFTQVRFEDDFWWPRLETNRQITIPYDFKKCEETGRIDNFLKAAGKLAGPHEGRVYNDSDAFKILEGAAYSLSLHPDPELDAYLDDLIAKIADAQEEDGYLYTLRTIDPEAVDPEVAGRTRWSNLRINHELYNLGHLYEAAVAHYQATGKRSLLDVALKSAELVVSVFGPDKRRDVPGHQEIELGLVKLYGVTGEECYLELAKFFLDERGHANGRALYSHYDNVGYMQDHLPVTEQREAVGHAVRAVYMYAAMADVAVLTDAADYVEALDALWENVVSQKMYLTGGIGSRHRGEAFGEAYELPNLTAYTETCAAIANIMWNHRMFLLHGEAKYLDVLERTLYNGFLSGTALSGDRFFYSNPLESDGVFEFNRDGGATRNPWFSCSCCPTNVVRLFPSLPGYVYAHEGDTLYLNLFIQGGGTVELAQGRVVVRQETRYPWDGTVRLVVEPEQPLDFDLAVRIPGWTRNQPVPSDLYRYLDHNDEPVMLTINGEPARLDLVKGFAHLKRTWQPGDVVELHLPMPVRRVVSHGNISDNAGKVAIERGPVVYCAEGADNSGSVGDWVLPDDERLVPEYQANGLGGVMTLRSSSLTLIPYYAWSHRGVGPMAVWLRRG